VDDERIHSCLGHGPEDGFELVGPTRADDVELDTQGFRRLGEAPDPGQRARIGRISEQGDPLRGWDHLLEQLQLLRVRLPAEAIGNAGHVAGRDHPFAS